MLCDGSFLYPARTSSVCPKNVCLRCPGTIPTTYLGPVREGVPAVCGLQMHGDTPDVSHEMLAGLGKRELECTQRWFLAHTLGGCPEDVAHDTMQV